VWLFGEKPVAEAAKLASGTCWTKAGDIRKHKEGAPANWKCSLFLQEPVLWGRPFFFSFLLGAREFIGHVPWLPLGVPEGKAREVGLSYFS